jgi:hypothetical protein
MNYGATWDVRRGRPQRCAAHRRTRRNAPAHRDGRWRWARWEAQRHTADRRFRTLRLCNIMQQKLEPRRPRGLAERFASALATFVADRDSPRPAASVAHHDAPLIGERAATRGRSATEGGDAHASLKKRAIRSMVQPRPTPRPIGRPSALGLAPEVGSKTSSAGSAASITSMED